MVRGAKAHQTGAVNSHRILDMPTKAMKKEDADYAVPLSSRRTPRGLYIYGAVLDTRKPEGGPSSGQPQSGGMEALIIFDNLFIPGT